MIRPGQHNMLECTASETTCSIGHGIGCRSSLSYRPLFEAPGVEVSDWTGTDGGPALATHFHHEAQLTVVRSGARWFSIGSQALKITAGEFVIIPPGVPHQAIGHRGAATRSYDVFFDQSSRMGICRTGVLKGTVMIDPQMRLEDVATTVLDQIEQERAALTPTSIYVPLPLELIAAVKEGDLPIVEVAKCAGMSREGFIRKFHRNVGMTPHAYRIADRVCRARVSLRCGITPANVAYDAGFADQSHLGRVFRKLYGTTPAVFRKAWLK